MDTNKAGHATRMDVYNTCDDMAAVLQVLPGLHAAIKPLLSHSTGEFDARPQFSAGAREFDFPVDFSRRSCVRVELYHQNEVMLYIINKSS